jgi:hypothetical protein
MINHINKFIDKVVKINDHNFNLFVYLILTLLIVDTLTNNSLSSIGINKIALLTFLGVSAVIKAYFKFKDKIIIDNKTIKNVSPRKMVIVLSSVIKKIVSNKKIDFLIVFTIIGIIFLYQKSTQQVITYLTRAGIANYVVYGILIVLYILIVFTVFHEKNLGEDNKLGR